jgi:outer membrane protein assembly factor BamA
MRCTIALLLLILVSVASGADSTLVVRHIDIQGLRQTHRWVIERELQFSVGDTVSPSDLRAAQKRLANLPPVNHVSVAGDSTGTVAINVNELWPIWPIFSAEFSEGQISDVINRPRTLFDKVTFFAGLGDLNFRGNASKVYAMFQFGAATGVQVGYSTRWFSPRLPIALQTEYANLRTTDRHAAVLDSSRHLRDIRAFTDVGTRQGAPRRLGMVVRYQATMQEHLFPAEGRNDRVVGFTPYLILDTRDLEWYPTRGSFCRTDLDVAQGTTHFVRSTYDARGYFPVTSALRPVVFALNLSGGTSTQSTPSWAHYYYGFSWGLRGYRSVLSESANYLIGDAELRFPITRETTYNVDFLGRWGENWPWGISGVLFGERAELQLAGHRTEYLAGGAGLYFRIPYLQIVELSAALNKEGVMDYALMTGVYF